MKIDYSVFKEHLLQSFDQSNLGDNYLCTFAEICVDTLDMHALRKKKFVRGDHVPFINKELLKAVMKKGRLLNRFLQSRSEES